MNKPEHPIDKALWACDIWESEAGKFFLVIALILGLTFGAINLFTKAPEPLPPVVKTETFSHKSGRVVRESGIEFIKGVVGLKSKLDK